MEVHVCQGSGPIIEEVGEEEVTPAISFPPAEATTTSLEPLQIMTGPTPPDPLTPPGPLTSPDLLKFDVDLVRVNSLYYNINIFLT